MTETDDLMVLMLLTRRDITNFMRESLRIEGINREPTGEEIDATRSFLAGDLTVAAVVALQAVYAPNSPLRALPGMDVRVGGYTPPRGQLGMGEQLEHVLAISDPWRGHIAFEKLHPFMDGNGRTGRAVWAWLMWDAGRKPFALPFLHSFYYQTLAAS